MNNPTAILSAEHQHILKVLGFLTKASENLAAGASLDKDFFNKVLDFIRGYADQFHHLKEEEILFAELNKNQQAMPCNPISQMLYEHDLGRGFVKGLAQGLAENNSAKVAENAKSYAELLQEHIFKEDNILYPMADQALSQEVQQTMLEKFQAAEQEKFGPGGGEKYLAMIKELERRFINE